LLRRLGLPAVILLAAVACDLAIVIPAAFDSLGPRGRDLLMLPGIAALAACALWARSRPALAAFAGGAVLVASSLVLRGYDVQPYRTLLANVSLTETVAGFELVYYCVLRVRGGVGFVGVASLVIGALIAVGDRSSRAQPGTSNFYQSLVFGALLLGAAVLVGLQARQPNPQPRTTELAALLRAQWPLIGVLCLILFFEAAYALDQGPRTVPVLLCSFSAATLAVLSVRSPLPAAMAIAGVLLSSGVLSRGLRVGPSYVQFGGLPPSQILAGMAVVVVLLRYAKPERAWVGIGVLAFVVAEVTVVNHDSTGPSVNQLAVSAILLLGISVAIGLFLRSRDSERAQIVQSAVTDAQTSERMALARDLHDVVAHHVTGIVVLAQAAKLTAEQNPKIAADVLGRIDEAGTEALAAMRRLVRSMRGDTPPGTGEFSEQATTDLAADLRKLVDSANHGVPTTVELDLPPHLPHEVGRSALRLVQESLTNVGKHAADASGASLLAEVAAGELHVRVTDNGNQQDQRPAGGSGGYGLIGMRERVELLHGRLFAGRGPNGGWCVEAWLPLEGD
jgi:signal transduction histidine kinase